MISLEVLSDMSEKVYYNLDGFPMFAGKGELRNFHQFGTVCHWHPDLEFILILSGEMNYFINGETVQLKQGEGIFINSNRLHYNYSKNFGDCTFLVIVIHPALLGVNTALGKEYFEARFGSSTENYCLLKENAAWQNEALKLIQAVYIEMQNTEKTPLSLQSLSAALCAAISENIQPAKGERADDATWVILWNMTGYIQKNYASKISLNNIAAAGSICRSKCCEIFRKHLKKSPNVYLTEYRLGRSLEMLRETTMPITEIALACGFQSSSYFTLSFRKELGITPKDYRSNR